MTMELIRTKKAGKEVEWKKEKLGNGSHTIDVRPIRTEIQKAMPPEGSKPFTRMGILEVVEDDIKSVLENGI